MKERKMAGGCLLAVTLVALGTSCITAAPVPGSNQDLPGKSSLACFRLLVVSVREGTVSTISPQGPWLGTEKGVERDLNKALRIAGGVRLWEGRLGLTPNDKPEGTGRTFREWWYSSGLNELHWRVAHGHVWAETPPDLAAWSCHKIPLDDLPLLDEGNVDRGVAALRAKYRHDHPGNAEWYLQNFVDPGEELWWKLYTDNRPQIGERLDVHRDILPTGPASWDMYFLTGSRLHAWHCTEKGREGKVMRSKGEKGLDGIDAGFQEPFFVYGKPESPFFVTKSGKVFQLLRPEGKEPRVEKLWDDPKRPVTTILNDADTGRTFVAGRDLPEGPDKWFYFELADKIEKKPFDRSAVTSTAEEPLKSALLFARFLAKEGLVKDKPKE